MFIIRIHTMQQRPVTLTIGTGNEVGHVEYHCSSRTFSGRAHHSLCGSRRAAAWLAAALALPVFLCGAVRAAQTASLAWNPPTTSGTIGYAFYIGSKSGTYSARLDVGTNTSINLTGLIEGHTNYFAVTAYNAARMESPLSPEVAYVVPGLMRLTAPARPGLPNTMSFPVASGHLYSVEASTDLKTWTVVYTTPTETTNTWVTWQDPQSSQYARRFYRLIMN